MNNIPQTKSAFIAIIGKPNVGKSSIMNALLKTKVSIVSKKPQTTRTRITGVYTKGELQLVFIDTPGIHKPKNILSEKMVKKVKDSMTDVDAVILVVEPAGAINEQEQSVIDTLKKHKIPAILCINKIDTIASKDLLLKRITQFSELFEFDHILPISALNGEGLDEIIPILEGYSIDGPHFFPDDIVSDQPEKVLTSEIIREKILNLLFDEVPHGTAVVIETFKEREDSEILDITATIFCEKASHKGIIIGKNGAMLKQIGTDARIDLQEFFGTKVYLQCWVKVKEDWRNREGLIRSFGIE